MTAYHVQGKHCSRLDQAVEVSEDDGDWQQQKIHWMANIVTKKFDEFAHKYPGHQYNRPGSP